MALYVVPANRLPNSKTSTWPKRPASRDGALGSLKAAVEDVRAAPCTTDC
jgi:hypothetical protein